MTATLLIAALILANIAVLIFVRGGTRKPTPQPPGYEMRYKGGDAPCVVCGRPTRGYTLNGRPIHPECREDVA